MKISAFVLLGLWAIGAAMPIPPSGVDFMDGWEVEVRIESENCSTRPFAEDCQNFCSHTYPEHTYPEVDGQRCGLVDVWG
jgi:hypothetical protein